MFWKALGVVGAVCLVGIALLAFLHGGDEKREPTQTAVEQPAQPAKKFNF